MYQYIQQLEMEKLYLYTCMIMYVCLSTWTSIRPNIGVTWLMVWFPLRCGGWGNQGLK